MFGPIDNAATKGTRKESHESHAQSIQQIYRRQQMLDNPEYKPSIEESAAKRDPGQGASPK